LIITLSVTGFVTKSIIFFVIIHLVTQINGKNDLPPAWLEHGTKR